MKKPIFAGLHLPCPACMRFSPGALYQQQEVPPRARSMNILGENEHLILKCSLTFENVFVFRRYRTRVERGNMSEHLFLKIFYNYIKCDFFFLHK